MQALFGDWAEASEDTVFGDYQVPPEARAKVKAILYGTYIYENYTGDSDVLFVDTDGVLQEVHGAHCSCYGLEGQWEPSPVNPSDVVGEIKRKTVWGGTDIERKTIIAGLATHFPSLFVA